MHIQTIVVLAVAVAATSAAVLNRAFQDTNDELIASASEYDDEGHGDSGHYGGPGYITKFPVGDIYGLGGHHDGGYGHGGGGGGGGYGHHSYKKHGPPVVYIPGRGYHGCTGYPWYLLRKYNIPGAEGEYSQHGPGCHDYHHYGGHHKSY